jgi:hypothetical protein
MAKDYTGVRPLGVLTRHPADWFSDISFVAGWSEDNQPTGAGEIYTAFGMLNSDNQGRVLRIYGNTCSCQGGGGMGVFFVKGAIGSVVAQAQSIRPDFPPPLVTISSQHQQTAAGAPNPFNFGPQFGLVGSPGFDSGTAFSPFPLFIVPVGWSIVVTNFTSTFVAGIGWWFQMAPQ